MEADWSVEIGPDLPIIDASWEGFIDLRHSLSAIDSIPEAAQHPALRNALLALNTDNSPVFTTKCDTWTLAKDEIDPDEFEARIENAQTGFASYIDLIERDSALTLSFGFHEQRICNLTSHLRQISLPNCRVDLVLRAAVIRDEHGYGLTLYTAGCGLDAAAAYTAWQTVLAAAVAATIATAAHPPRTGE
jgi:hypothetical protein